MEILVDLNGFKERKTKPKQSQFVGEAEPAQAIPKAFGFEAATQGTFEKTKPI